MLNNKKGQGLSLNTIIIAIIVLVVLVVIIMIFTGVLGGVFVPGISSCEQKGGDCNQPGTNCGGFDSGWTKVVGAHCDANGDGKFSDAERQNVCCVQTSK